MIRALILLGTTAIARADNGTTVPPAEAAAPPRITTDDGTITLHVSHGKDIVANVGAGSMPLVAALTEANAQISSLQSQLDAANSDRRAELASFAADTDRRFNALSTAAAAADSTIQGTVSENAGSIRRNTRALSVTETKAEANRVQVGALETQADQPLTQEVSIYSSGYCAGHRVQLSIGGVNHPYMGGRGMHLYVFNTSGNDVTVASSAVYDTNSNVARVDALAALLRNLPMGTIIAVGCYDECHYNINTALLQALELFGSRFIRGGLFREAWAMVGIKGAPMGSVAEDDGGSWRQERVANSAQCFIGGRNLRAKGGSGNPNNKFTAKVARATKSLFVGKASGGNYAAVESFRNFMSGALANSVDRTRVIHSGRIIGGGRWPYCNQADARADVSGYVKLATIYRGPYYRYIRVWVYGSHRGHSRGSYMEHEEDLITCGDKCSSYQLRRRGNHRVGLWNPQTNSRQNEFTGAGNVDIPTNDGFNLMLRVDPYCGANFRYSYRVEVYTDHPGAAADSSVVLDRHECWNLQGNGRANRAATPAPYFARFNC